jgi:hypothetical protein
MSNIAKELGISRQALHHTYYTNIDEIVDALHFFVNEDPTKKLKAFVENGKSYNEDAFISFLAEELLPEFYDKKEYIHCLLNDFTDSSWRNYLENSYADIIKPYISTTKLKTNLDLDLLTKIIVSEFIAVVSCWLKPNQPENYATFSKNFIVFMHHSALDLLKTNDCTF